MVTQWYVTSFVLFSVMRNRLSSMYDFIWNFPIFSFLCSRHIRLLSFYAQLCKTSLILFYKVEANINQVSNNHEGGYGIFMKRNDSTWKKWIWIFGWLWLTEKNSFPHTQCGEHRACLFIRLCMFPSSTKLCGIEIL